eukprot:c14338_g1_i2 orf=302-511(-)
MLSSSFTTNNTNAFLFLRKNLQEQHLNLPKHFFSLTDALQMLKNSSCPFHKILAVMFTFTVPFYLLAMA